MNQAFQLTGKTAVVTGGTRGIGRAIALGLAESGANIVLLQRSTDTSTQESIKALGVRCEIVHCDMENLDEVKQAVPKAIEAMGSVDILVNNAGIQRRSPAVDFTEEDWDDVIKVNLKAVWILCQEAGRHMLEKNNGKIINIASIASFQGGLYVPAYASAKGAVGQLTKALANEWSSEGINVNAIVPGYIATEMNTALIDDPVRGRQILERIPAGRWGNPEDFKGAAVFLASDASNYVHGHLLAVDGGWLGR
ncbi:SDR family oxidoreductase [Bacillus haynesii]|uniref:SDR family oxidoreductase n=1 Tax=Bacillus haynesii TaxID=1925021 RepID=UPI0012B87211|nr:SDR family oxidoreductase [Bacillus haynesii]TWK25196.1 2-dehydro-3-deoxy-D-gluconate 5-dehydrogenase [Bacillus licheniformis]MCY7838595.1 SDR family oxidoreductase [Bacillus haynesii]MCY7843761.1 SDR family oxidoreductase [Bacillus haynesii]MCY7850472.1 SDR family oxidoreductase [Bacillus haynesii]MCY7969079.1 SDR family oxidoreductase [Bacillus haynesii]